MDPEYQFGFTQGWPNLDPVRAVKVVKIYKSGHGPKSAHPQEADEGPIALIGDGGLPVFRGKSQVLHPFHVSYISPSFGLPIGALLIGAEVDVIACAWTCALEPEDRALLEGMRITPNFVPQPRIGEVAK